MRKVVLLSMMAFAAILCKAEEVNFTISDGIDNAAIKSKIENTVSKMLSEINDAQDEALVYSNLCRCCGKIHHLCVQMMKLSNIVLQRVLVIRCVISP